MTTGAAVVGTVLNLINQGDRLFALRFDDVVWWSVCLTYLVPFRVSVFSAARIRMIHRGAGPQICGGADPTIRGGGE